MHLQQCQSLPFRLHSLLLYFLLLQSTLSQCCVHETHNIAWTLQDELIERLGGVDAVAEMSGRKRRMVKQPNGVYKYCLRSGGDVHLDKVTHKT